MERSFPAAEAPRRPTKNPKWGTTWTYRYYIYHQDGSCTSLFTLTYKAKSLDTLGGETWLRIIDVDADTTVYYPEKQGRRFISIRQQRIQPFLQDPASLGDSYTTYNEGGPENFIVKVKTPSNRYWRYTGQLL